jgi:hypothetical protein
MQSATRRRREWSEEDEEEEEEEEEEDDDDEVAGQDGMYRLRSLLTSAIRDDLEVRRPEALSTAEIWE